MEAFYLTDSIKVLSFLLILYLSFASSQTIRNQQRPIGDLIENDLRLRELSDQMITFRTELTKQFEDFKNEYLIRVVTLETKLEMLTKQMDRSNPIEIIKLFSESQKQICKLETSVYELKTGIGRLSEKQQIFENVTLEVTRQQDVKLQNLTSNVHQQGHKIDSTLQELNQSYRRDNQTIWNKLEDIKQNVSITYTIAVQNEHNLLNVSNVSTLYKEEIDMMITKFNENHVSDNFTLSTKLNNLSIEYDRQFRELQRFAENMTMKSKQKIAFTATIPRYQTYNTREILNFTNVITNVGGGLNTSDGVFYCPEPGMYYFFINIMSSSERGRVYIYHRRQIIKIFTDQIGKGWNVGSNAIIIHLDKSDKVYVMSPFKQTFYSDSTFFTGFKI